jgi:hypothetical protein
LFSYLCGARVWLPRRYETDRLAWAQEKAELMNTIAALKGKVEVCTAAQPVWVRRHTV